MKTQTIAAIDIGSNSLKLIIVEAAASDSFTVVLQDRERVRLGHETLRNKFLSPEAISASADAIAKFRSIAESRAADVIIAVATASVREAANSTEFIAEVQKRTGITVEVLSSLEEARLIGVAVAQFFGAKTDSLLNIDIGGGSTELSLMRDGSPDKLFSMKLGAVGLTERFISANPPKSSELKNIRAEIAAALDQPLRKIKPGSWHLTSGTSGTVLRLTALAGETDKAVRSVLKFEQLVALNKKLTRLTIAERSKLPGVSPQRAEVITAGGLILECVMKALKIESIYSCSYALREGVIIDYLREIEAEALPPVPDVEDKRLRDVFALGRRFGYEENHALQVAALAEKIFDQIAPIYNLKRHGRTLLAAAALLHDVGYHISHESHHKHSLYLIKHSEITGFSETEKLIIANIARYHRRALPKETHADYVALNEKNRELVARLGGILRLAEALDHGYENHIRNLKIRREKQTIVFELFGSENSQAEIQAVERKKDLFEAAFGCKTRINLKKDNLKKAATK